MSSNDNSSSSNTSPTPITNVAPTKLGVEVAYQTLVVGLLANVAESETFVVNGRTYTRDRRLLASAPLPGDKRHGRRDEPAI